MEYKIVSAYTYKCNGLFSNKNDKSKTTIISCNSSECKIRDKGFCIQSGWLENCIHGKTTSYEGYTKRSKNFNSWISKEKEKYKDIPNLGSWDDGICEIGDYIYLPYSQISTKFETEAISQRTDDKFIEKEKFNVDFIYKLANFKPYAVMGGRIKSYTKEEVPRLLSHIKERYPSMFEELVIKYPDVVNYLPKSNIGRKAFLLTLKGGCKVDYFDVEFTFNGEYLICDKYKRGFMPFSGTAIDFKILPPIDETIEITNESQVDNNTKFK